MSSVETQNKKRKSVELTETSTLVDVLEYIKSTTKIYHGLKDYLLNTSPQEEIYRLVKAAYIHDITAQGCYVVPELLRTFQCKRDAGTDKIIYIRDQFNIAQGRSLARLLTVEKLKKEGYDTFIFEVEGGRNSCCLALRSEWQLELDTASKKRDHVTHVYKLYHANGFNRMFVPLDLLSQILSYDYITLKGMGAVVSSLNSYSERLDITVSGPKDLSDLGKLVSYTLTNNDTGMLEGKYVSALLSCASASSSLEEKAEIFKGAPSPSLARSLSLFKPYAGQLCDRTANGTPAKRVRLIDLDASALVQLSTVAIDTKFYDSVTGDLASWLVYEASDNLCVKKGSKGKATLVTLTDQPTMKASALLELMEAIAKQNAGVQPIGSSVIVVDEANALGEIDF